MGTKANFFIGLGDKQKWLGSALHDTYPDGLPESLTHATSAAGYRRALGQYLAADPDDRYVATLNPNSDIFGFHDYEYTFANGKVLVKVGFDDTYYPLSDKAPELFRGAQTTKKPRMARIKKAPRATRVGARRTKSKPRLQAEVDRLRKKLDSLVADINRMTK